MTDKEFVIKILNCPENLDENSIRNALHDELAVVTTVMPFEKALRQIVNNLVTYHTGVMEHRKLLYKSFNAWVNQYGKSLMFRLKY